MADIRGQEKEAILLMTQYSKLEKVFTMEDVLLSKTTTNIPLLLKNNNQRFIELVYNLVIHAQIKYIDIKHHYIKDKVAKEKIDL